ncbi:MAG: bifunctional 5,10-methylenetetrahydrofolate dehydrogenase/5,10-methenyltetrahydrofolate cyclohydrolase [bacterium]
MPIILDGKKAREVLKGKLVARIQKLKTAGITPCLAIVQVGNRADSSAYIGAKKKFAIEIGVVEKHIMLSEAVKQEEVMRVIDELNSDVAVHGIIVQLPLPFSIDKEIILNAITPTKDVDGLSATNVAQWSDVSTVGKTEVIWPATTRGILELLYFYGISLKNKKVAIIGRSALVGKPTAAMCVAEGGQVTVCHRQTTDLAHETSRANVVIAAAGAPRLIGAAHVRPGQVIIDVGLSKDPATGKLAGDVDFDAVSTVIGDAGAITPVPGGVGQMTVLALFENLIDVIDAAPARL